MAALYALRSKVGLADLRHRLGLRHHSPTQIEAAAAREHVGETAGLGDPSGAALARRIATAYSANAAQFGGYGDSMWEGINRLARPMHDLLDHGAPKALADALDHPHTTNLFLGFDNPVAAPWGFEAEDRNLLSNEVGPDMAQRIYLAVRRLAEATGAVQLSNPETLTGTALPADDYLAAIDRRLGIELDFPNFYPHEKGLVTRRGIVSYRPLQAIYQAHRLKSLGAAKVLEIGAGLGRTAYYAYRMGIHDYTIVDIPMSNVAQTHFLSRALGEDAVSLPGEDRRAIRILGPNFVAETDERFDVVLNVDSLSEMDRDVAAGYLAFARSAADTMVSINREWADSPRIADMAIDVPVLRMPYWMREGYVEEIIRFRS
jgi:hypothetical protein